MQMAKQIDHIQQGLKEEMEFSSQAVAAAHAQGVTVNVPSGVSAPGASPADLLGHMALLGPGQGGMHN